MSKTLESQIKVRFQDCDPFNHLNNSCYLDYFFNAREDQLLKEYDLDIYKLASKNGKSWVVASNQISYFVPAVLSETLIVQSQIVKFSEKSIQVEMRMFDSNKKVLKALMWSKFVYFNIKTQKSAIHTEEFMTMFEDSYEPIKAKSFEERIANILKYKIW